MPKLLPTEKQLRFMDWEMGAFFHFGIRSFYPGHRDWDEKPMSLQAFSPAHCNPEEWIKTVKAAGCRYAILTCKHHDGFCNWPSEKTAYSVKNTPWQNGNGDVVRLFTNACRAHGLGVGLYYSPAQWGTEGEAFRESNGQAYDDYFIGQISELLTDYGKIDYLWFDGCGSEEHPYDQSRIVSAIRQLQPDILIFNMWDPDTRWCGNEDGYAGRNNFNQVGDVHFSMMTADLEQLGQDRFLPAECDVKMRDTWFDDDNADTVKTPDELLGIWEMSVGCGANMLINIGPDRNGQLPQADVDSLMKFHQLLEKKWCHPLPGFALRQGEAKNEYIVEADEVTAISGLMLCEDQRTGQNIEQFTVSCALPGIPEKEILLYQGLSIGHKAVCRFPCVRTCRLHIRLTTAPDSVGILQKAHIFK